MATDKQKLGELGEQIVIRNCSCPRCKKSRTLRQLRQNFKCADIICDFCGYLAQVKAISSRNLDQLPRRVPGAAWNVQKERLEAGIYMPLFLVQVDPVGRKAIYYLPADFQGPELFIARKPLSDQARRSGWQGFMYDLTQIKQGAIVRLL